MVLYQDINTTDTTILTDSEAINQSVKNIISTDIGTVPGQPEFGCNIKKYLFEQMDVFTKSSIESVIANALYRFESRITNIIVIATMRKEYNSIYCNIEYTIKDNNLVSNISIKLK